MPFDPLKPANNSPNSSAEMRAQLTSLKALLDAGAVTQAQVSATTTLPPGMAATAAVLLSNGTLVFTFGIPAGPPGEVTQAQLSNDLVNCQNAAVLTVLPLTSNNSNAVALLEVASGDFVIQTIIEKVNELLTTLRR